MVYLYIDYLDPNIEFIETIMWRGKVDQAINRLHPITDRSRQMGLVVKGFHFNSHSYSEFQKSWIVCRLLLPKTLVRLGVSPHHRCGSRDALVMAINGMVISPLPTLTPFIDDNFRGLKRTVTARGDQTTFLVGGSSF